MPATLPARRWVPVPLGAPLDESTTPVRNRGLMTFQNGVYRRFASAAKRSGSAPYGTTGGVIGANPTRSGTRWHRGRPSSLARMVVQSGDALYTGNDISGAMTLLGTLAGGSTPAFFASVFDPAESGVGGTPASDVLAIAYGSGAPMKYDGTNFVTLSPSITNPFTGVVFWHERLWFWGDPAFPDTVFATDLGNPESFAFSNAFGGYSIGRGDGDATVQCCIPIGDTLFVFKNTSIFAITGFDFQAGDYQFAVTQIVSGYGLASPKAVARLRDALVFWTDESFYRLAYGSNQLEYIGRPIPLTSAQIANGNQNVIRAVAGDFLVSTLSGKLVYNNLALFAVDVGTGIADTIMVFDDDASVKLGEYAWSTWKGFTVGAWIPWTGSGDQHLLFFGDAQVGQVYQFGADATADVRAGGTRVAPQVLLVTGRVDCGTPDLVKHLHNLYIETEANAATFATNVVSEQAISPTQNSFTTSGNVGGVIGVAHLNVDALLGPSSGQSYQAPISTITPSLNGRNFQMTISETSTSSAYELIGVTLDVLEETYYP